MKLIDLQKLMEDGFDVQSDAFQDFMDEFFFEWEDGKYIVDDERSQYWTNAINAETDYYSDGERKRILFDRDIQELAEKLDEPYPEIIRAIMNILDTKEIREIEKVWSTGVACINGKNINVTDQITTEARKLGCRIDFCPALKNVKEVNSDEQIFDGTHCPECGSDDLNYLEMARDIYGEYTDYGLEEDDMIVRMGCNHCNGTFKYSENTDIVVAFTDGIE